jgi:23S rRNA (uracil1939-C5)-methyltransferase
MDNRKPPQIITALEITDLASEGMGLAKQDGLVIFVENTITGDIVDVMITRKKSGFRQGKPIHFHKYSELRRDPLCEHFGVCGGCKWQTISYPDQLKHKEKQVFAALKRIAKVQLPALNPILGAPAEFYYRNKLEYTFSATRWLTDAEIQSGENFENRNGLGFHIPGRFDKVLNINTCHLQVEPGNAIRRFVKEYAIKHHLEFFDLREQTGLLRNLILRNSSSGEWMFVLAITRECEELFELLNAVGKEFPQLSSINYAVNSKRNDSLYDLEVINWKGLPYITEHMEDLQFRIGPKSFYQTNSKQAYELYKVTRDFADIQPSDIVYDLYTGTGTIALFVSKLAAKVAGIEYVTEAVADAEINAGINGIANCSFTAGDMKDVLEPSFFEIHGKPDVIITDPPRAGMHESVVMRLLESGARRIVYVSCNAATQARDIAMLDSLYEVTRVQPVDMFPQTTHVENVVALELRK